MQLRQGKIIQKQKMQQLSSLFMTHRINVMHALVKFHEYIPYSLGVMARTRLTIWNLVKDGPDTKVGRTDGRIGGGIKNASCLPCSWHISSMSCMTCIVS